MNKTMKILGILLVAVMLISVATPVFAGSTTGASSIITTIEQDDNAKPGSGNNSDSLIAMAGKVVGLIRTFAVIAGVILLAFLGVKFMMGSAEEKAEYKKSLIPLAVGVVVVMAATQIAAMVFGFFE